MNMIWNTLLAGTLASVATAGGTSTLILDDFDADPNDDAGGPRALSTTLISGGPFGGTSNFDINTGSMFAGDQGSAVFETGTGVEMIGTIRWDNDGDGLSLDAAALGLLGFELDFAVVDQDFDIALLIQDGSGNSASVVRTISALDMGTDVRTDSISLGDFDLTGFDATDVDAVQITFNRRSGIRDGVDFALTEFRAVVPTPGSAGLLAIGGLLCTRRKR